MNTSWWFITHLSGILSTRKEMAEQLQHATMAECKGGRWRGEGKREGEEGGGRWRREREDGGERGERMEGGGGKGRGKRGKWRDEGGRRREGLYASTKRQYICASSYQCVPNENTYAHTYSTLHYLQYTVRRSTI